METDQRNEASYNLGMSDNEGIIRNVTDDYHMDMPYIEDSAFRTMNDYLHIYLTPVIIFVGVSTNILSFLVFMCTYMRLHSSSIYLAALAISDSAFLLATFFSWLSWVRIDIVHQTYLCHIVVYLTYISSFLSIWTVVSFTVERYIVVCHPFHRQRMCTVRRAKIVVVSEAICAIIFYSYALWTTEIVDYGEFKMCGQNVSYMTFTRYITYIDTIITLIIPSIVIILLNTRITIAIYQFLHNRWTLNIRVEESHASVRTTSIRVSRIPMDASTKRPKRAPPKYQYPRKSIQTHVESTSNQANSPQMKTTRMLLVVSAVFVVLNLPSHVLRIHKLILADIMHTAPSETQSRWSELMELVYYTNFSTNFFLYTMCTRSFREATRRLFLRIWTSAKTALPSCISMVTRPCSRENKGHVVQLHDLNMQVRVDTSARS